MISGDVRRRAAHRALVLSFLLLLACSGVTAGDRRWWHDAEVQLHLALTQPQVSRIDRVFESDRSARVARRRALERLEVELQTALTANDFQKIERERLIERIERLRTRINVQRTMMLVDIYQVLSPAQRRALSALDSAGAPLRRLPLNMDGGRPIAPATPDSRASSRPR